VIYLDSSAILKLLIEEPESAALVAWVTERADTPVVTSELAKVEVIRACRRVDAAALPAARALLGGLDLIPLRSELVDAAADVAGESLRSLDAIHLASALSLRADLSAFVAYDQRLAAAAAAVGLETVQPGG
jgi:predicted nucleic acid-binding protein